MQKEQSIFVRITVATISALVVVAAAFLIISLVRTVLASTIPFDTDEANHAVDGWEVYHAIAARSVSDFYRAVTDQSFYPPVHSFFVAAAYALAGASLATSRLPTIVIFAFALLLLGWLTFRVARDTDNKQLDHWLPLAGAAFAVAFALTSEVFVTLTVLAMLEMTGALFGLLLLLSIGQADRGKAQAISWRRVIVAAVIAMLIFLTKYSFGLFYLPGLIAGFVTATWPWQAGSRAWRTAMLAIIVYVVGLGLWLAVTHRETMLLFFTDHPDYAPLLSGENLLYLPRLWFARYSPSPIIGLLTLLLAAIGARYDWQRLVVRVAVWSLVAGFVILTLSTTDEPRHFLPLAPALWLLAGLGLVTVLHQLQKHPYGDRMVVASMIGGFLLLVLSAIKPATSLRAALVAEFEGVSAYTAMHRFAVQNVDLAQPLLFTGDFSDQNGLLSIRWLVATVTNQSLWDLDVDYFPFENHEHSLIRTHRKPQIATVDPTFPRQYMNEVLARDHFAYIAELKELSDYFGPRSGNPDDPLCGYPTQEATFDNWIVIIYALKASSHTPC